MESDKIKVANTASPFTYEKDGIADQRSSSDMEKGDSIRAGETTQLKRKLQSRHLQMIAIGKSSSSALLLLSRKQAGPP